MRAKGTAPGVTQANGGAIRRSCAGAHGTIGAVGKLRFLVLLVAIACADGSPATGASCPQDQGTISFAPHTLLNVQVADDDASREQGLMGVTSIPENSGMAFTWTSPTDATFWMKDTLIPLSIAFVGQDGRIVTIKEMTPCTADPCTTYGADAPYTMALEANANWFEDNRVQVGDPATFTPQLCS
jgi:uncharacterized protein